MSQLADVLRDVAAILDRLHAHFAVMGGLAVRAYGIPRATYDIDLTVALARERLPDFYAEVEQFGYTVPEAYRTGWVDEVAGMPLVKFRLYLEGRGIDIDVFLAEFPFQQDLLSRRRQVTVDDLTTWLVTPEDLILLKLVANRPRDLLDVADILFMQGQLDTGYMRHWAAQLGVQNPLEKVLEQCEE